MTMNRFEGHKKAHACILTYTTGSIILVSYSTSVAMIDRDGWLHINGLYSRTTIKHIGWFMKMFGLTYQDAKQIYMDDMEMNIYTGEVRKI